MNHRFGLMTLTILLLGLLSWAGDHHGPHLGTEGDSCINIKILVTNDVHGRIFEDPNQKLIGYALIEGRINELRQAGYDVYLMDAGDAVSGNAVTQFDNGRSVAELMGRFGYRVVVPGNHAFDFNYRQEDPLYYSDVLLRTMRENGGDEFDAVCLNLTHDGGDVPGITRQPVLLIDEPGFRLAVIGVLTPYTRKDYNTRGVPGYDFGLVMKDGQPDHAATKQSILDQLADALTEYDRPGDIVVVLSHIGSNETEEYNHGELRGSDLTTVPNVDFVVDSHSHNFVPVRELEGVPYGIAGRYLDHIAELTIRCEGGGIQKYMEIKGYDELKDGPRSERAMSMLREISDNLRLGEQLFELAPPALSDENVDRESIAAARLVCKGMTDLTGSDLAIINSGNIRGPLLPGWVTTGAIYDMIPYQNNIVTFEMTGAEIREIFDRTPPRRTNAFPQIYGMSVYMWETEPDGLLEVAGILDRSGSPLEADRLYRVALNEYIAYGGDGYIFNTSRPYRDFGDMVTSLVLYFRNRGAGAAEAVRENDAILIYPSRHEAEEAFGRISKHN